MCLFRKFIWESHEFSSYSSRLWWWWHKKALKSFHKMASQNFLSLSFSFFPFLELAFLNLKLYNHYCRRHLLSIFITDYIFTRYPYIWLETGCLLGSCDIQKWRTIFFLSQTLFLSSKLAILFLHKTNKKNLAM